MNSGLAVVLIIVLMVALALIGPIAIIWGLNVLFPVLAIPYTMKTWLAVVVVAGVFKGVNSVKVEKK